MRTKPGVDTLSFEDLYNNLRVSEPDVKGSTASSSSTQNVVFVSSESTSSTNEVSTAYGVSTSFDLNSQREGSSSYTDEIISFTKRQRESCILMPRNQLALTRPKLSASIATIHGTLLESADQKEIKKAEEEMQETLDTKQETMGGDPQNKMNLKLCDLASCESNSSVETHVSMPKPVINKPKAVSEPKVWSDAPIIEEYESDSDDEYVLKASVE
nr:hypothetical protein [Tanacetum cinerariifolium]